MFEYASDFPVANIPFGIISTSENTVPRLATVIGDIVIDLSILDRDSAFTAVVENPSLSPALNQQTLNAFAALPASVRKNTRKRIQEIWTDPALKQKYSAAYIPAEKVTNHLPMSTINYTDYVSSRGHFENIQNMIGAPESVRAPFYHMPTGYYGNSRDIVVSGTSIHRFRGLIDGQFQVEGPAVLGPSAMFDFELELGVYLCKNSSRGTPVPIDQVDDFVFGFVLLNDWSGRDIQRAESGGPTGPFLAKSGSVTVSPWIITMDAIQEAGAQTSRVLQPKVPFTQHLQDDAEQNAFLDIRCTAAISAGRVKDVEISRAEYKQTYWTHRQLLAHQTCNGAQVGVGDLLGTGTMSLFESDDTGRCCLFERSYNGSKDIDLGEGERRRWLLDGDETIFRGGVYNPKTGQRLFGFGECRGRVVA